jgi:SAM-dependent methyltransferase
MEQQKTSMRADWDLRAKENARFFISPERESWDLPSFFADGKKVAISLLKPAFDRLTFVPYKKRILEIGCGIGRLFPGFAEVFGEIWGIDVSPEMVRQGSETCPVSNAKFFVGNGYALEGIETESIDYCFSYAVFQHIPDTTVVWGYLAEIYRVLRPEGAFQLHFQRRRHLKGRVFAMLPGSFRVLGQSLYGFASMRWLRGRSIYRPIPGNLCTWTGSTVSPEEVVRKLIGLGFSNVETFRDLSEPSACKFWAIGRKGREDEQVA